MGFFENDEILERMALSADNLFEILSHLKLKDLVNTQLICKKFGEISRNEQLWNKLFKKHFYVDITGSNSMQRFIFHYSCMRAIEYRIPDFKPAISANSSVKLQNEEFQKYHQAAEKVKKDFVTSTYKKLCAFIDNDKLKQDIYSTTYLQGQFLLTHYAYFKDSQHAVKHGKKLIFKAAENGHPAAMLDLLRSDLSLNEFTEEQKNNWINKLYEYKLPDISFRLAIYYQEIYHLNKKNLGFYKNYFELLIQAAKQGQAQAAYELARCYLTHYEVENSIPFDDSEWECFALCIELSEFFQQQEAINDFKEKLNRLERFTKQGIANAASLLVAIYQNGNDLGIQANRQLATYYRRLAPKLWHASIPARKERAIYWLEQAAEEGVIEAQALLKKIKETDEHDITSIFDYGSRENSPLSSPDSSPQNSPRSRI